MVILGSWGVWHLVFLALGVMGQDDQCYITKRYSVVNALRNVAICDHFSSVCILQTCEEAECRSEFFVTGGFPGANCCLPGFDTDMAY